MRGLLVGGDVSVVSQFFESTAEQKRLYLGAVWRWCRKRRRTDRSNVGDSICEIADMLE